MYLEGLRLRWSIRLKLLNKYHPFRTRIDSLRTRGRTAVQGPRSSLRALDRAFPAEGFGEEAAIWARERQTPPTPRNNSTKPQTARAHYAKITTLTEGRAVAPLLVYTDRLKIDNGVGWGAVALNVEGTVLRKA